MIESERCFLRPFFYTDIIDLQEILSNVENLKFIFPIQSDLSAETLAVHSFMKTPLGVWAIEEKLNQKMIGVIRLEKIDERKRTAELGYFLNIKFWNKGLMSEVVNLVSQFALNDIGFKELFIITHKENISSQRVALKSGFKFLKSFKGSDRYTHKMKNYYIFRQTKDNRDE